ncbi:MAG: thioredoxin family protein, partial [Verrucomicrobiota bacterium]
GLVYGSGVIVSFLTLAGLIIAVQQAGRAASWGMQFQNPQFLVGMTVLVTLVALNLFGVFEVTLGGAAMGAAGTLAAREGSAGAFFNGVLATALATPCTAPFLAPALGFALAQPPAIILLFFFTIGLGLALPYVVLSWIPAWLRFLPKPGAWMEKFKIIMGFPMLATAFWLFSLTASHYAKKGTLWFGLFLVTLALAVWIWGQFVQHGTRHRLLARVLSVLVLLLGYFFTLEKELRWRAPVAEAAVRGNLKESPDGIDWEPWSREAVQAARAAGRPVLVDFTADWCLTCQLNKRTSIEVPDVRKKLKELNAVALLGDYTRFDPAITEELKRFQRAGVPLVVVFPADPSGEPIVLPEALLPGIVLNALEKAAAPQVAARNKTGSG